MEDEHDLVWCMMEGLSHHVDIQHTDSAVEAMRIIRESAQLDVLVCDRQLIEGQTPNGVHVIRAFREKWPDRQVVYISGDAPEGLPDDEQETVRGTSVLLKPFSLNELLLLLPVDVDR